MVGSWSPAQASMRELIHYTQLMQTGNFQKYDEGPTYNQNLYGQSTAPILDLGNIDLPVGLFVGKDDPLADPFDTQWVRDQLHGSLTWYQEMDNFDHSSFMGAVDMSYFKDVLTCLRVHNRGNPA